ncbi:MAG: PEP-CTERM sorting domain-containing protein [Verrucomicrobia bacterium]|nr:PEP-CTERM sorting domain-containing protein [Verrucomicrobiota bacterium]
MKKALIAFCSLMVAVGAFAQGQVNFAGRVVGVYDAPVSDSGGAKLSGAAYLVQLYAGATSSSLSAVGAALPFRTGTAAGYWTSTALTIPASAIAGDGTSQIQVRAWAAAAGATYEAASAAKGAFGSSNTIGVKPTNAPDVPATLAGLQSFALSAGGGTGTPTPEPSTLALGALGGLALLFRRRK